MADISKYLSDILNAVYGEQVRGSIYNAIDIINKSGERVFSTGTAVNSQNSSIIGYFDGSLYLNTNSWDLWKCDGTRWVKQGNLKGANISSITKKSTSGLVDTYNVNLEGGSVAGSFTVTNGERLTTSKSKNTVSVVTTKVDGTTSTVSLKDGSKFGVGNEVTATNTSTTLSGTEYYSGDLYFNNSTSILWKCTGTGWENEGTFKGEKGDQGYSISSISKSSTSGLVDTYTVKNSNNVTIGTFTVTNGEKGDTGLNVVSVTKIGTSGNTNTYQFNLSDGTPCGTIDVIDGKEIESISKTSTSGLVDTYSILFNDGTTGGFTVTNGIGITNIRKTSTLGLVDTYTISYNDGTSSTFEVTNGANGNSISNIQKTSTSGLTDIYTISYTNGTTSTFEVNNGYTPTVNVSKANKETTISVTNKSGTTSEKVFDGFDPIVEITKTGTVATITITDINGPHSFQIRDGESGSGSGDMLKSTYDTNDDGIIDDGALPIATITQIRTAIDAVR